MKVLTRDPGKVLNTLADHIQELIALISEQQLMEPRSKEFEKSLLLSAKFNRARLTQDKTIFSVTGLQGAGKTTFVKRLYHLEDGLLPIAAGRNESLPILITESEEMVDGQIWRVRRSVMNQENEQCDFILLDEIISHQEFLHIAENPSNMDLWLEMIVPVRHFGSGISLALLPGYERESENRSQRDLDFMLSLSTSVIFVINHRMLAREEQQAKIRYMIDRYKEHAPLFAISFSDHLDPEKREATLQILAEHFNLSAGEEGRVTFLTEDVASWEQKIVDSINRYGKLTNYAYKKHMEILRELSQEALLLTQAVEERVRLNMLQREAENDVILNSEVISSFRAYKKKLMNELEQVLQIQLSEHAIKCSRRMDKFLVSSGNPIVTPIKHFFKGDQITLKEKISFREKTRELWNDGENQSSEHLVLKVLNKTFTSMALELGFSKEKKESLEQKSPQTDNPFAIKSYTDDLASPMTSLTLVDGPSAIKRLTNYLNISEADSLVRLEKDDLRILPLMAIAFTEGLIAASPALQPIEGLTEGDAMEKVNTLTKQFKNIGFDTSTIIKGAALFMGIDVMDGTFDTLGALSGLLVKLGVSSSAAGPAAVAILGGLAGGLAVRVGIQKLEQYRLNQSNYANKAFTLISVQQKESVLSTLERVMEKMEERLQNIHSIRNREGAQFGKLDTTKYKAARIKEICGQLQGMTLRNELYLG